MEQHLKRIEFMRKQYPPGTRIRLIEMKDPYAPVPPGTEGVVTAVDDIGTLHMQWDNGRTLGVVFGEDSFMVIAKPPQSDIQDEMDRSLKIGGMTLE
jgi:hypothetical protein